MSQKYINSQNILTVIWLIHLAVILLMLHIHYEENVNAEGIIVFYHQVYQKNTMSDNKQHLCQTE